VDSLPLRVTDPKPQAPSWLPRTNDRSGSRGIAFDPPRAVGPSPAPVHQL